MALTALLEKKSHVATGNEDNSQKTVKKDKFRSKLFRHRKSAQHFATVLTEQVEVGVKDSNPSAATSGHCIGATLKGTFCAEDPTISNAQRKGNTQRNGATDQPAF